MLRTYLLASGVEQLTCPVACVGLLLCRVSPWWAPLCACQRHVIITERRTVRSCALHPGCWGREPMSALGGGGEGVERRGCVDVWSTCAAEQGGTTSSGHISSTHGCTGSEDRSPGAPCLQLCDSDTWRHSVQLISTSQNTLGYLKICIYWLLSDLHLNTWSVAIGRVLALA